MTQKNIYISYMEGGKTCLMVLYRQSIALVVFWNMDIDTMNVR